MAGAGDVCVQRGIVLPREGRKEGARMGEGVKGNMVADENVKDEKDLTVICEQLELVATLTIIQVHKQFAFMPQNTLMKRF